jgi:hypothetical protein
MYRSIGLAGLVALGLGTGAIAQPTPLPQPKLLPIVKDQLKVVLPPNAEAVSPLATPSFDANCRAQKPSERRPMTSGRPETIDTLYQMKQAFPIPIKGQALQFFWIGNFDIDVLCVGDAAYSHTDRVEIGGLKDYIEAIQPDATLPNGFILKLKEGNGLTVPIRHLGIWFDNQSTPIVKPLNVLQQSVTMPQTRPVTHKFSGKQGQSFTIDLDSRSRQPMPPHILVMTSQGTTLAEGIPNPIARGLVSTTVTLPGDGEYTVQVSNLQGRGSYMLSINGNQQR